MKNSLRSISPYAFDACLFALGAGLLLSGCFATKAQVTENDSPPPEVSAAPEATQPALDYFKAMSRISGTTRYSLDVVHQPETGDALVASAPATVALARNSPTTLVGWAVDLPAHRSADAVYVLLDTTLVTSCHIAIVRPDVATALGDQVYAASGFSCLIPAKRVVAGRHKLTLDIVAQGGHNYYAVVPPTAFVVR